MDCEQVYQDGAKKIAEFYKPILDENQRIISNMEAKNNPAINPHQYYDSTHNQIIDLVELQNELKSKITEQVNELRTKVDNECGTIVDALQFVLDNAIAYYTDGITLILPKHITHIDVAEILKGNIAGGDGSFVNEVKDKIYQSMGIGAGNDIRIILDNPVDAVKDFFGSIGIHL